METTYSDGLTSQPLYGGGPKGEVDPKKILGLISSKNLETQGSSALDISVQSWPQKSQENYELLRSGKAIAVITGQQPCLWGGPSLVLHKILHTLSIVEWLKGEGVVAVPVFWNASEDHDLQEMLRVGTLKGEFGLESYKLSWEKDAVAAEVLRDIHRGDDRLNYSELVREVFNSSSDRFADQISHALLSLFGEEGLVVIEPRDLVGLSEDFWKYVEQEQSALIRSYDECESKILQQGRGLQAPRRYQLPIFCIQEETGERKAYQQLFEDSDFSLDRLGGQGLRPSPGALLRPLMAQWCLPIGVTVLGPAEARYHEQLISGYDVLGLATPIFWPRFGGTWVPDAVSEKLGGLGLDIRNVIEQGNMEVAHGRSQESALRALSAHLMALRQEGVGRKAGRHVLDRLDRDLFSAMGRFERGLMRESLVEGGVTPKEADELLRFLLPRGSYQERHLGWASILRDRQHLKEIRSIFSDPFDTSHRIYS